MAEKSTKQPAARKSVSAETKPAAKKKPSDKGDTYTDPALRERLKEKIKAGDKGGSPGQWSARKAQLLAHAYKEEGGGYKSGGKRTESQQHLTQWTEEKWQTADGKKAIQGKTTSRYLPKKAWDELTPAQRQATDEKKKAGSRTGKQFVANTAPAKRARQKTT